jgi:hypothetical protein
VPLRRLGRPGLLGSIGRDCVIAGTAAMTKRALQLPPEQRGADQHSYPERQEGTHEPVGAQEQVGEASLQSATAPTPDLVSQLSELAVLRSSGAMTEEEFRRAKARLLNR